MGRVVEWGEANDEDIGDVARCGSFFDLELPGLRDSAAKIKWWHEMFPFTLAVVFGTMGFISVALMIPDQALLTVKETKKHIFLSSTYVKPINGNGFRLVACGKSVPDNTGFSLREQQILCEAARDPDLSKVIAGYTREQRWALSIFVVILLFAFSFSWAFYREMTRARMMHARLARRPQGVEENKADDASPLP